MANPHKGEVTLAVNGSTYLIRLDTDKICGIEAELGQCMGEITKKLDEFNFSILRALLRGALGGKTTFAEASAVIDAVGYVRAVNFFMEAYRLAYPVADDTDTSPPMGSEAGTGLSS
jgi:hypothetical protein